MSSTSFKKQLASLNKRQLEAVEETEGPVMVIAGPGTGKTQLISFRVARILERGTARASNILCLTFTETAASNMRDRLLDIIGPDAHRVAIYTFHGFCTEVMGRYPEYFYNASRVRPASELVQSEILEYIFARLPNKHPLGAYHHELGYSYLKETQSKIKDIKKGGLTPLRFKECIEENKEVFATLNPLLEKHLPERISKDAVSSLTELLKKLESISGTLPRGYATSLKEALSSYEEEGKTTHLTSWKTKYTGKTEDGARVFKDSLLTEKLLGLAYVYEQYQKALYDGGYFDYEDMIIEVVEALKKHVTLRTELEEQYQYIMVDEFQDTNNAQLTLVKALSGNPVHEGRANVCVVGDDDQAVYKFQGAEISNIHSFSELYTDVKKIVLVENYRSTQKVLDFARLLVSQGVERLENKDSTLRKELVAKNKSLAEGEIVISSFDTQEEEYAYVATKIQELLKQGEKKDDIAIIAREHKQLRGILSYLDKLSIPYTYTREENVFDEQHVRELVILCRYLGSLLDERGDDSLLPEILAFPFWGFERVVIWEIAERAKKEHVSWLAAMQESSSKDVVRVAQFLIELGVLAKTTPLEIILDTLIGSKDIPKVSEDPNDDSYDAQYPLVLKTDFTSPYKEYYFGGDVYKKNPSEYISFLSSLRVFVKALREYKEGERLLVSHVGPFVDMHVDYSIPLINKTPFAHNEDSIQLLTSHGAKGLEFSHVFVIAVNDAIWAGKSKGNKLAFPVNLPLSQTADNEDDFIRLLYVAFTRARHSLFITHHESPFRFLEHESFKDYNVNQKVSNEYSELLTTGLKVYHVPPFAHNEKALLKKVVEDYKLSPTHLNNFLNIIDGGPMKFLEQNLLRFPQAKHKSSVYGTAIHKALEDFYKYYKHEGKIPPLAHIVDSFTRELKRGHLLSYEEEKALKQGEEVLARYYEEHKKTIPTISMVELDFSRQGVVIDGALLTGKIDKVIEEEKGVWKVVDIKTGKALDSWEGKASGYEGLKLHNYRHQLMMYKVLIEHSRDYATNKVKEASLEFVEEEEGGVTKVLPLAFQDVSKDELETFTRLIVAVYQKIVALDFPDTSKYPKTLEGIKQFEEDLISGAL